MAYGLRVYKQGTNNYSYANTAAGYNTANATPISDDTGMLSTRSEVWEAFGTCIYAPATPTETVIKNRMTIGLGASRNNFISYYYGLYVNGTDSYRAIINNDRKIAVTTLSPYPMNQADNEVVVGALSTDNLTTLFIGTSSYNIPDHDTSFNFGSSTNGYWKYDQVKSYGGGSNTVQQYGTVLPSSNIAPNMLGTTSFNGINCYCEVNTTTNAWRFDNGTNFTIEFYFQPYAKITSFSQTLMSTSDNSISIQLDESYYQFLLIKLGQKKYVVPNYNVAGVYKYAATERNYHLAITRNSTTVRIFIDGEMVLEESGNTESIGTTGTTLTFGGNGGGAGDYGGGITGNPWYYTGWISSPRIVKGKSIYNSTFPKITRLAKHSRAYVLQQMTKGGTGAQINPLEENIQYHRLVGIQSYTGGLAFSSEDISWNMVWSQKLAAGTALDKYFTSCVNRTVTVVQTILGSPSITSSYSIGEWFHTPSTGRVYVYPSGVETYIVILMR